MIRWHELFCVHCVTVLLIGCCAVQVSCQKKPQNQTAPDRFRTLVVYDVEGINGGDIPADELAQTPRANVAPESVKKIFEHVTWKSGSPLWKTGCLGMVSLDDGAECRIAISHYGGIFVVLGEPGYYVAEGKSLVLWDDVMEDILVNTFIPARKKGQGRGGPRPGGR